MNTSINKSIILVIITAISITTAVVLIVRRAPAQQAFSLEWHEITTQNFPELQPTLASVEPVFIDAFVPLIKPYVYAHDPRFINLPAEKRSLAEPQVITGITESLKSGWAKRIEKIRAKIVAANPVPIYLAIARGDKQKILGFALLTNEPIKDHLATHRIQVIEGSMESIDATASTPNTRDQVYVSLLAVVPEAQGKGVGKALLFTVLTHCPHIKTIGLSTSANPLNKKAQAFYEHLGFVRLLKGVWDKRDADWEFDREKIVYGYQKP